MLNPIMLNINMLSVIIRNAIWLIVVAPYGELPFGSRRVPPCRRDAVPSLGRKIRLGQKKQIF